MSKKVKKRKTAQIILEPDGFSIHTFELSMKLSKSEWKKCKQRLYADQEEAGEHWIYLDKQSGHYIQRHMTLVDPAGDQALHLLSKDPVICF